MGSVFWGVLGYVAVQFAIGVWVSRRVKTTADFVIAGRTLGLGLVSFSIYASFFGAEAIVGSAGSTYEAGLAGSRVDPFGYAIAMLAVGLIFAVPLWKRGLITFADFFRQRYSRGVETLVVVILLPGSIFWGAAQILAFGQIMSSASGLNVPLAIGIAAVMVVAYSALGGLLADAWTDLVQGLAIVAGLMVLLVVVVGELGGVGAAVGKIEPERLQILDPGTGGWLGLVESLAIPICGTVVAVEMISRILGARSATVAMQGAVIGALLYLAVGLIPVFLGLVGPQLLPDLESAETIVPALAEKHLGPLLYVMFAGAIVSAILSTVDTVLLASSAQVAHNILAKGFPDLGERGQLLLTRATLIGLAAVAFGIALVSDRVKDLVETASAAGSSGVFVVAVFGLFTSVGGPLAAIVAMVTGAGSWLLLGPAFDLATPYLVSLGLAFAAYVVTAGFERSMGSNEWLTRRRSA